MQDHIFNAHDVAIIEARARRLRAKAMADGMKSFSVWLKRLFAHADRGAHQAS